MQNPNKTTIYKVRFKKKILIGIKEIKMTHVKVLRIELDWPGLPIFISLTHGSTFFNVLCVCKLGISNTHILDMHT